MSAITLRAMSERGIGHMLREWRQRRRLSQLELALAAGVSTRHLSFVETGRSRPSPDMVLGLADHLDVPLRERNQMLLAAGYAPRFGARSLDDPELVAVRDALGRVLDAHEPYPALAVDRGWNLVASNAALGPLMEGVSDALLTPPVNVLRLALHPDGLAPRIRNLAQWRGHLMHRLAREQAVTGDPDLAALLDELAAYPGPAPLPPTNAAEIMIELHIEAAGQELHFFSTVTTFGTALDVTVAELAIEAFFPADAVTARALSEASAVATS
jgi:transcriptional regulator with XRE-family HTH domain